MPRVLVVEDEPSIAEPLVYALETSLFSVLHCLTASRALAAADAGAFDLAILDIGLPDMNGFDLCRELHRKGPLPVMFLTARGGETERVLGLEIGGDDYVTKPFSPREVVARARAILRRSAGATSSAAPGSSSGSLAHDTVSMRISCHGTPLDLTAHEYRLLLVMMRQPGRVFTREQLLDHAWQDPGSVTDRTVDAHVKSIRAKLRAVMPGAEQLVETRRGLGYSVASIL